MTNFLASAIASFSAESISNAFIYSILAPKDYQKLVREMNNVVAARVAA